MPKANVLTLVDVLSNGLADSVTSARFYDEAVIDLVRGGWIVNVALVAALAGEGLYELPVSGVSLLATFYDDREMSRVEQSELEWITPQWRDRRGIPVAYVTTDETDKEFRLFPQPDVSSKDFSFILGSPMGLDFPEYAAAVLFTEVRDDLPDWLDLPLTFVVLGREFARESAHRDFAFAATCEQVAKVLIGMVG